MARKLLIYLQGYSEGEKPTGEKYAKSVKKGDDLLSTTDEDSLPFTEVADQSGGYTLGSKIFEALIQMNLCFRTLRNH
jgi:hypothetical protein